MTQLRPDSFIRDLRHHSFQGDMTHTFETLECVSTPECNRSTAKTMHSRHDSFETWLIDESQDWYILSLPKGRGWSVVWHRFLREGLCLTPLKKGDIAGMSSLLKRRALPYPFEKGVIASMTSLPKGRTLPYPSEKGVIASETCFPREGRDSWDYMYRDVG